MYVYIKGMKMPMNCERCPMLDWDLDYIKCKVTDRHFKVTECWRAIRVPDCPLVPVPEHGDLIDRDPFIDFIKTHWDSYDQWFVDQLEARPTIIPAEEGE